jgi:hypothetical protein
MNAIVTINYLLPRWSDITLGRMGEYADRIGAILYVARPEVYHSFLDRGPIFSEAVTKWDRVALIDADCVISRQAPDIFAVHPGDGRVWMVPDCKEGEVNKRWLPQMVTMQAIFGSIYWFEGYGNFGVTLVEPCHVDAFFHWHDIQDVNHDQTCFNYLIRKFKYKLGWMARPWNSMAITLGLHDQLESIEQMASGAHIAHIAGFNPSIRQEAIETLDRLMP